MNFTIIVLVYLQKDELHFELYVDLIIWYK